MRVGVLGGGQLGRMLALAGYPMGLEFRFLDPAPDAPAGMLAECITAEYTDASVYDRFADGLDVITYEFENVPVETVRALADRAPVYPPPAALSTAQDRLAEKQYFQRLDIPTPPFAPVESLADLYSALRITGLPAVLKTRRMGYDGKGQATINIAEEAEHAWESLGGRALILEGRVPFDRELSVLAVRGRSGETVYYPLPENHHRDGLLRRSIAPATGLDPELQTQAEEYARRVLDELRYVGVLALELFQTGRRLSVNEMAPRVHNSGHWTIEGAATSQFENHLRAVLGLPLGPTEARGRSVMVNIIGEPPTPSHVLAVPNAHLHLYGKAPRPGRKLGHITLTVPDDASLAAGLRRLDELGL